MNFPENLTDDFLGLFIGVVGTLVIALVVFMGPDNLREIALGALIAWVGAVLQSLLPRRSTPQE